MKRWVKWTLVVIGIIAIALVTNSLRPRYDSETGQWCFKDKGYCVYNIPNGMLFTSPDDYLGYKINVELDSKNYSDELSEYLIRDNSSRQLGEIFGGDYSSYICKNTRGPPKVIEYFYNLCSGMYLSMGCWHDRRAIVCGDIYYVNDFTSSHGPRYYGPFTIGKKPEIITDISAGTKNITGEFNLS